MDKKHGIYLILFLPLLIAMVACGGSDEGNSDTSVEELAETRAAEIIAATKAFDEAVAAEIDARATADAGSVAAAPTSTPLPIPTSTPLPIPTATPEDSANSEAEENAAAGGNFNVRQEDPEAEVVNVSAAEEEAVEAVEEPEEQANLPEEEPEQAVVQLPPLFPIVKQGAPGDRQGIQGSIFSPEGLQISADPAVFGQRISFLLVGAFDEAVGTVEGDGVDSVAFAITDESGTVVYQTIDNSPYYCAFGNANPCDVWDFSAGTWPNGTPVVSGNYNAKIQANGSTAGRFSIWTYDFAIDLGDSAEVAVEPEPVVEEVAEVAPTPTLFPVVKQGAPSQKNGVLGNVYAPEGLQISSDPAIFGNNINFMLLEAYDEASGSTEYGAGVRDVTFTIQDSNGQVVYTLVEGVAAYCAFGGDIPCNTWNFAQHGNSWPGGTRAQSGNYKATIVGVGNSGASSTWNYEFAIQIDDSLVPAGPTVRINNITISGDRYVVDFVTTGYQPVLPGQHIHFFFNTVPPGQAGAPGGGPWVLYPNSNGGSGASPFTLYGTGDKPAGATQMCALVANPNHSVQQGTGNCYPLP